ncbi:ABC transporter [Erysipelotrichaceae bacterium NYU-BL-E8]|uniref:ABC transporter n=2 Tax=Ileibacterium valens TaxID=1862668 RepID=A0A1U7NHD1_9FIRM|nr:ABC transporter [Erysipelotrichaceae bacterium NYU-BL-F16]OLU41128.1 ABC transporter [Ileibacterium valens]OLU42739.1 ABC transporter [Erysipelotrichaceae bacterium NYU-BL-E8]
MPKNLTFGQCLKHLWIYIRPNQKKLWIGLALVILMQVIYVIMPLAEGQITSQLQLDVQAINDKIPGAHIQMDKIFTFLSILLGIYIVKITSQFISAVTLTDAIQKTIFDLRNAVEHKINRLPVSYFDSHPTGDLLSRITNDVETVSNALQQTLARVLSAIVSFILILFSMSMINTTMTLIVLIGLPIIALISVGIIRRSQPIFDQQQAALANMSSTVNEMYTGFSEILIYNQQDYAKSQFEKANREMQSRSFLAQTISGTIGPLTSLVTYTVIGLCCLYGCLQVLNGTLLLGQLQAFIRYIWNINDPVSQLSQLSSAVQSAFSGMNRLFSFLDLPEEEQTQTIKPIQNVECVDFEHVSFSYTDQPLMKDVTFTVKKNQTVAIVGHTGAGKTTLTNLLLRYYPYQSGFIRINSQDINDFSFEDLRSLYGLVLQDPWLFEGTIEENLRYAKQDSTDEEIAQAIRIARLEETIDRLPDGLKTHLSENADNLSQGEKQLLTIARAILKDPQILILDEATSSVDTRLEKRLQEAVYDVVQSRTCFVIAHRLSTILNADLILVMDHGHIVESGTHQQLLEQGGIYASLYMSQFQDQ